VGGKVPGPCLSFTEGEKKKKGGGGTLFFRFWGGGGLFFLGFGPSGTVFSQVGEKKGGEDPLYNYFSTMLKKRGIAFPLFSLHREGGKEEGELSFFFRPPSAGEKGETRPFFLGEEGRKKKLNNTPGKIYLSLSSTLRRKEK